MLLLVGASGFFLSDLEVPRGCCCVLSSESSLQNIAISSSLVLALQHIETQFPIMNAQFEIYIIKPLIKHGNTLIANNRKVIIDLEEQESLNIEMFVYSNYPQITKIRVHLSALISIDHQSFNPLCDIPSFRDTSYFLSSHLHHRITLSNDVNEPRAKPLD
ncbi:hypothetical protein FGO68_gene16841 [Halteria grandinella]|uniref:RNA polymerase alpha subunit n=1 Tax=Halteria grandinella TaxID=5974 RepID=A0A8J8NLY1_HALGN|nr:hypothetical protein FGO68_gene16841 [Halteria grandinella]